MRKRRLALIMTIMMLLTLLPVSISSAASQAPGKVTITSVTTKKAVAKVGKGTVSVKWKKLKGASKYQVYIKRIDGSWKMVKTVKRSKTSAKVKAYVGTGYVKVRAVKTTSDGTKYGKFSKAKKFRVTSDKTLQSYFNKNKSELKELNELGRKEGVNIKIRDNDIIYIFDLANVVDEESAITAEVKKELKKSIRSKKDVFSEVCYEVANETGIRGIRAIVIYEYNGSTVVKQCFQ